MRATRYSAVAVSVWLLLEKPLRVIFPAESLGLRSVLALLHLFSVGYLSEKGLTRLNWVNGRGRRETYLGRETEKREKHEIIVLSHFQMPHRELRITV